MATATATKTFKGFKVVCPFCGDAEATVHLNLNDLTACHCTACDEEFSPHEALDRAMAVAARWESVVQWIESAKEMAE